MLTFTSLYVLSIAQAMPNVFRKGNVMDHIQLIPCFYIVLEVLPKPLVVFISLVFVVVRARS